MGQKTHPYGFRLGYNNTWRSRWYAGKNEYGDMVAKGIIDPAKVTRSALQNAASISAMSFRRPPSCTGYPG